MVNARCPSVWRSRVFRYHWRATCSKVLLWLLYSEVYTASLLLGDILLTKGQASDILQHLKRVLKRVRRAGGYVDAVSRHRLKRTTMTAGDWARWTNLPIKFRFHSSIGTRSACSHMQRVSLHTGMTSRSKYGATHSRRCCFLAVYHVPHLPGGQQRHRQLC